MSFSLVANDPTMEGWKTYFSYTSTDKVEESADQVFAVAEGSLYTYGKEDNSIKQYHKGNGLNGNTISFIRYNKQTKSLLLVYDNSDIDILKDGITQNIPYLSTSTSIKDKTINSITIFNEQAYLATAFGIVVIDMNRNEIKETYNLSLNITSCAIKDSVIYAVTTNKEKVATGMIHASLQDNLLDKTNWKIYTISNFPTDGTIATVALFKNTILYLVKNKGVYYDRNGSTATLTQNDSIKAIKVVGDKLACINNSQIALYADLQTCDQITNLSINDISTYQTDTYWIAEGDKGLRSIKKKNGKFEPVTEPINIEGPYSNSSFKILCQNDKVYVIPGGKVLTNGKPFNKYGSISIYDQDKWGKTEQKNIHDALNKWPRDYTSIVVTTNNAGEEIIYASSLGDGLIQYQDRKAVKLYDEKNSPIENAAGLPSNYCFIDGLAFDKEGNLWMTNSEVSNAIKVLDKNGKWHSLDINSLKGVYTINNIFITSDNDKWVNVPRHTPKIVVIADSDSLDKISSNEFTSFIDTDGINFSPNNYTCITEDKKGYIWVGTNRGMIYFTDPKKASTKDYSTLRCSRVKVFNEQNNNYHYFLDNFIITTIKVDPGNRKWIGTQNNGVYVLDNDNQEMVYQFNTINSPLPSDHIYSIDINDQTGEVFIGTDKGLVSYAGEATEAKADYSEIYAYPNPVRPEYRDKVTIIGLMDNSNVKITDINGNLLYQTKSLGGQAVWNCRNRNGVRVATGVYLVLATTDEAAESVVTKIIIVK